MELAAKHQVIFYTFSTVITVNACHVTHFCH